MKRAYIMYRNKKNRAARTFSNQKKLSVSIFTLSLLFITLSCNRDEVFEREQYKNVFALISESNNVARNFHPLGEESIGFVAASLGGTNPTTKDIVVNLVEDQSLLDDFNRINYDTDVSKYGKPLPASKFDIESYQFTINAGDISGRLPIKIRPDGLSPDTAYYISLRVESHSSYEINPEKSFILYQVRSKNFYAQADGNTSYSMRAKLRVQGSASELEMPGSKIMHPISDNKVRVMAGNETYESNINKFNQYAIILEVDENNNVEISPYGNVEVVQVNGDPEFPNIFKIEDDGFKTYKTFLLRYNYKSGNTIYEFKEELRLEFDKDEDEN